MCDYMWAHDVWSRREQTTLSWVVFVSAEERRFYGSYADIGPCFHWTQARRKPVDGSKYSACSISLGGFRFMYLTITCLGLDDLSVIIAHVDDSYGYCRHGRYTGSD